MTEKLKKRFERRFESRILCDVNHNAVAPSRSSPTPYQSPSPSPNPTTTTTTTESNANSVQIWRPWEDASPIRPSFHLSPHMNYSDCDDSNENRADLRCKYCPKRFTRKDNLTRHIKMKHIPRGAYKCKFCYKPLSRPDAVARHENTCHNKRCRA